MAAGGPFGPAAYAASKGGIVSLALPATWALARFGISVNTGAPGIILTPLLWELPEAVQADLEAAYPFPVRLGHPAELADAVVLYLTNRYMNAEVIRLDGGLRLLPR